MHRGRFKEHLRVDRPENSDHGVPEEGETEGGGGVHLLEAVEKEEHGGTGEPGEEGVVLVRGDLEVLRNQEGWSEEELKPIESAEKGEEGGDVNVRYCD